jgi:hypothetical protein
MEENIKVRWNSRNSRVTRHEAAEFWWGEIPPPVYTNWTCQFVEDTSLQIKYVQHPALV